MSTFGLYSCAREERCVTVTVIGGRKETYASVYTDYAGCILFGYIRSIVSDRYVQIELAMAVYELSSTDLTVK